MKILIVYATNSGGTQFAAEAVAEACKKHNHHATLKRVSEVEKGEFSRYDMVILGSCTWDYWKPVHLEGQPHEDFFGLFELEKGNTYEGKKFAVFGLGDKSYLYFCGSVDRLEEFVKNLKGTLIGESLRIDGFYRDQGKNTENVQKWCESLLPLVQEYVF